QVKDPAHTRSGLPVPTRSFSRAPAPGKSTSRDELNPVVVQKGNVQRKEWNAPEVVLHTQHHVSFSSELFHAGPPENSERGQSACGGLEPEAPLRGYRAGGNPARRSYPQHGREQQFPREGLEIPVQLGVIAREVELTCGKAR